MVYIKKNKTTKTKNVFWLFVTQIPNSKFEAGTSANALFLKEAGK